MLTTVKRWIQSTIGVSSREANAFLVLLPTMFLMIFSQPLFSWLFVGNEPFSTKETILLDSALQRTKPQPEEEEDSVVLFSFDPNKATIDELKLLGIPPAVAKRIDQYRSKGGKFKVKKDLAKMYGLDLALYISLAPFIDLPVSVAEEKRTINEKLLVSTVEFDLNKADTVDLKSVKGIGSVLASRILKYRQSLGGFVQITQLKEVYGLDSVVIQALNRFYVTDGFVPAKLNVNQLAESELDKHPYLSLKQAKAIVTYRIQHGAYHSMEDLRDIKLLSEQTIQKIAPYLSFE